jgi:peptide/nickel transport system permease protein
MRRPRDEAPAGVPGEDDRAWLVGGHLWGRRAVRLRENRSLVVGLAVLAAYGAVALGALLKWGDTLADTPYRLTWAYAYPPLGPSTAHPFGVMSIWGIDIFQAVLRATPFDLALVGGSIALAAAVGGVVGALAGYSGGWLDATVLGFADVFGSVPSFLLIWVMYFGLIRWVQGYSSLLLFGVLLAVILWPNYAIPVRALSQEVSRESYVEAARATGAGRGRIVRRHILPNSLSPVFAQVPFDVYAVFFILTVFPFVACNPDKVGGGGFPLLTPLPSTLFPEWGSLLGNGVCYGWNIIPELNYWWMYTFPLAAIVGFGVGVALFCDGAERFFARR